MKAVSVTGAYVTSYGIPAACAIPLQTALAKVFLDGCDGLLNNPNSRKASRIGLYECLRCVRKSVPSFCVVDGDAWARVACYVRPDNSVDMIVLIDNCGRLEALPIEGKLGLDFAYPGDRSGSSVTDKELKDKFAGTAALPAKTLPFMSKLIVIVPKNGKEEMWRRLRRWSKGHPALKYLSCCTEEFLELIIGCGGTPCDLQGERARARRDIFMEELLSNAPLRTVRLAPPSLCRGCSSCATVCSTHRTGAIAMLPDPGTGALRPSVNAAKCPAQCATCEYNCPIVKPI